MSNFLSNNEFIQKVSRNDLIDILKTSDISSEIEKLDEYIAKLSPQVKTHCLKFLKKDSKSLEKLMPVTINRIMSNVNTMLELISSLVSTSMTT